MRAFDERTTVGLMLGQALGRNASCKEEVRRAQLELGIDVSASTAAFCKARGSGMKGRWNEGSELIDTVKLIQ